ncbi:putative pseudouridine transporter, partial [Haemophilus influenzae]
LNYLPLW